MFGREGSIKVANLDPLTAQGTALLIANAGWPTNKPVTFIPRATKLLVCN